MERLLEVKNLRTSFLVNGKPAYAVDDVNLHVNKGETVAIVGESGCGKSVLALSIMGLIGSSLGSIESGEIMLNGEDLLKKSEKEMRKIRGKEISMIFQEPMSSLNPVYTCGWQICELIQAHERISSAKAKQKAVEMLRKVEVPMPEQRVNEYPHKLSGGLRQRVMIAMAMALNPQLLIADEPTTALDVTIQSQILKLMRTLKANTGMSLILITHDLGVVAEMAQRVIVMYSGKVVEEASVRELFNKPKHPYTGGLLRSIPKLDSKRERLYTIKGMVSPINEKPTGCSFHPRCPFADECCRNEAPPVKFCGESHQYNCHKDEIDYE
jgi:oligopeptide/dipeptide ABC transporter ATP-binding protein